MNELFLVNVTNIVIYEIVWLDYLLNAVVLFKCMYKTYKNYKLRCAKNKVENKENS